MNPQTNPSQIQQVNFSTFKEGFSQGVSFLKRRFSSSDLTDEPSTTDTKPVHPVSASKPVRPPQPVRRQTVDLSVGDSTVSAPNSPLMMVHTQKQAAAKSNITYNPDRCKCLLIIDNSNVNWRKCFEGRKLRGDWDIRVEQTDFQSIFTVSSNVDGCFVNTKEFKNLRLDFVLVRQCCRDRNNDFRNVIVGFLYGGVPCVNSIQSVYNFADRAWTFSHLLLLNRRLGNDKFPLIEQTYTVGFDRLTSSAPSTYPVVVKVGHASNGVGKAKIQNPMDMLDFESVLNLHNDYATVEPFVEIVGEIVVHKIGANYKTIMRKRKSNYWKNSSNSSYVEQVPTEEKHKFWIDEVSQLFGGLDVCCLSAFVSNDGKEWIYKVSDSTFQLSGNCADDIRNITELVIQKMNNILTIQLALQRKESSNSMPQNQRIEENDTFDSNKPTKDISNLQRPPPPPPPPPGAVRRYSSANEQQSSRKPRPSLPATTKISEDVAEDTMGNLKKTFAGIFGDV